jgi:tripartite-type tricarboxylate transporter receptor subunit TctC
MPLLDTIAALLDDAGLEPRTTGSATASIGRRPAVAALMGISLLALAPRAAMAAYPDKPVKLVVPFAPGGGTDTIARILADEMAKNLGTNIIVDNRPGAGTIIGTGVVAGSEPDGYTLLMATPAFAVNPSLNAKMPFDTFKSFAPVALVARSFNVVVVNKDVPIHSIGELIAHAKEHPDQLDYGSFGNGTSAHLAGALFNALAGTSITHVPYKGAAPAITDLIGGQIEVMFTTVASVSGHIAGGSVRALAVTSAERSPAFPDLPTVAEGGVPGYVADGWYALYAPAGTPPDIIARLNGAVAKAAQADSFKKLEKTEGLIIAPGTSEELDRYIRSEAARWQEVIEKSGITAN